MSANTIQTIYTAKGVSSPHDEGKGTSSSQDVSASRKFTLQPMKYMLTPVNSMLALFHIRDLCNGVGQDDSVVPSSISPSLCEFVLSLNEILLQRNRIGKPTIFGYLPAPVSVNIIKQIIGDDGYYFKRTTAECQVDFIWHDRKNNTFLFWAQNNYRISRAMNAIRWRSNKIMTLAYEAERDASAAAAVEDYSDMPDLLNSDGTIYRGEREAVAPVAPAPLTRSATAASGIEDISDEEEDDDCCPPTLGRSYSMSYSRGEGCRSRISSGRFPEFEAPGLPE